MRLHALSAAERASIEAAAPRVLGPCDWAVAAWHHGSSVKIGGPARDVDIAVLAREDALPVRGLEAVARAFSEASGIDAIEFDVRLVNRASPVFWNQLLKHGRRIYERDRVARIEWEAGAMSRWLDFAPVWKRMRGEALDRWSRG